MVLVKEILFPEFCLQILIQVMKLTNFDIIETESYIESIFGEFRETEPFNDRFEQAGYES